MMSFILRLLAWIGAVWVLLRLLLPRSRSRGPGGAPPRTTQPPNRMVKDPICGMYMDARLAIRISDRGGTVYFCSEECRQKYSEQLQKQPTA